MSAGTKAAEKRKLLHKLLEAPVTNVRFSRNRISLDFYGTRISDAIRVRHESHVGNWCRQRKWVFVDEKIASENRKKSFKALCVHEAIEKFLCEKFGLNVDKEAHDIATRKEHEYLDKTGGNWRSHELIVYWDWHRLGEK